MTWPNLQISTEHLDSGLDNPALARADLKTAVEHVNAIAAEFGNVAVETPADLQFLQYNHAQAQWQNGYPQLHRYSERTYDHGSVSGAVTIDYNQGNVQRMTLTGNVVLTLDNWPTTGTVSVLIAQTGTAYTVTWPSSVRAANNDRYVSTDALAEDLAHISTIGSTDQHYLTLVRGYQ